MKILVDEPAPRWVRELARFTPLNSLLLVHGNVLDLDGHPGAGVSEVRFPGAAEYFYRFPGQSGDVFHGRQYFLEMMAPAGAQGGVVSGKIRVRSADQAPPLP